MELSQNWSTMERGVVKDEVEAVMERESFDMDEDSLGELLEFGGDRGE